MMRGSISNVSIDDLLEECEFGVGKDKLWDEIKKQLSASELLEFLIGIVDNFDLGFDILD